MGTTLRSYLWIPASLKTSYLVLSRKVFGWAHCILISHVIYMDIK